MMHSAVKCVQLAKAYAKLLASAGRFMRIIYGAQKG